MKTYSIKKILFIILVFIIFYVLQCALLFKLDNQDILKLGIIMIILVFSFFLIEYLISYFNYHSPYQKRLRCALQLFFDERKDNLVEFQKHCINEQNKANINELISMFGKAIGDNERIKEMYYNNKEDSFLDLCKKTESQKTIDNGKAESQNTIDNGKAESQNTIDNGKTESQKDKDTNKEFKTRLQNRKKVKNIFKNKDLPCFYTYFNNYMSGYYINCYNNISLVLAVISLLVSFVTSIDLSLKAKSREVYITLGIMIVIWVIWTIAECISEWRETRTKYVTECKGYNELVDAYKAFCGEEVEKKILY